MKKSNIKHLILLGSFLFILLLAPKISKAQSSCCGLTIISRVDCLMDLEIQCNGMSVPCATSISIPTPSHFVQGTPCFGNKFNIQPGITSAASITQITFPATTICPCDLKITLYASAFYTLIGNNVFNSSHTYEVFTTSGACCPTILAVYDPVNCTLSLSSSCI